MHLITFSFDFVRRRMQLGLICSLLIVLAFVVSACPGGQPEPAAPPPAAEEPVEPEAPAEPEEPVEPEEPAEPEDEPEPVATEEPEEEVEPVATEEPVEEADPAATEEPEEEAEPTETDEPEEEPVSEVDPDHGAYIMTVAGCGCHFNRDEGALAGGNRFETGLGVTYAPNITSDPETGLGNWSEQEISDALRFGVHPNGEQLVPVMPYRRFSVLSDEEALAVAVYLLSLDPVVNEVPERELTSEPEPFTPDETPPASPPTEPVARGEQLVTLANCTDCHTPYGPEGGPDPERYMSGAHLPDDEISANITPHEETGIGTWSEQDIADYMRSGIRPDGSLASGAMADMIDQRYNVLTEEDARAIAAYLQSIPAIDNDPYAD